MADNTSTGPVFRLVYRSNLIASDDVEAQVADILATSRRNNPARGITGALVVWDESVVQTLEGDEDAVRALYATIERDPRHTGLELVETTPGVERAFGKWSMARVADDGDSDIALGLRAWEGGVDVVGGRAMTTPDEDRAVAMMRERVGGTATR
ncbi:BLUF domain-containing protein [Actinomycetospora sp. NBRC 106378]|uniref:BLUF domain-containing protein n=1 Tax=Actinomycetospora sp. NBRC 106378 TaxID=3032208 RepID=UPI00249FDB6F|nr:BLUF domain-containing protein [Actinomycetospora sp. NBRC 106378]GLZ54337.1 hypothetical protein Acsp07_39540 [Actinomycetospora sp. NBRC 106378]